MIKYFYGNFFRGSMTVYEIIVLAIILSFDAFLVSFSYGVAELKNRAKAVLSIALGVAFFQFLMPFFGAFFTELIYNFIQNYAKYFAGIIFIVLGLKLFVDNLNSSNSAKEEITEVKFNTVLMVSVATSIDAFAAGSSLYLLKTNILYAAILIGLITFINSNIGFYLGEKVKNLSTNNIGKIGAILLILIGIKAIFL